MGDMQPAQLMGDGGCVQDKLTWPNCHFSHFTLATSHYKVIQLYSSWFLVVLLLHKGTVNVVICMGIV
jgi:hypothetical protein